MNRHQLKLKKKKYAKELTEAVHQRGEYFAKKEEPKEQPVIEVPVVQETPTLEESFEETFKEDSSPNNENQSDKKI